MPSYWKLGTLNYFWYNWNPECSRTFVLRIHKMSLMVRQFEPLASDYNINWWKEVNYLELTFRVLSLGERVYADPVHPITIHLLKPKSHPSTWVSVHQSLYPFACPSTFRHSAVLHFGYKFYSLPGTLHSWFWSKQIAPQPHPLGCRPIFGLFLGCAFILL